MSQSKTPRRSLKHRGTEAIIEANFVIDIQSHDFAEVVGGRTPEGQPRPSRVVLTDKQTGQTFTIDQAKVGHVDTENGTLELRVEAHRCSARDVARAADPERLDQICRDLAVRVAHQMIVPDEERGGTTEGTGSIHDGPLFRKRS